MSNPRRVPLSPLAASPSSSPPASPTTTLRVQPRASAGQQSYDRVDSPNDLQLDDLSLAGGSGRRYDPVGATSQEEDFESEGDLGFAALEARRREKGKGKMRSGFDGHDSDSRDSLDTAGPEDEAEQERRVAENLAQWSQAEKKRRQSVRKSQTLVLPSSPVSTTTLVSLSRRSSALIRSASRRTLDSGGDDGGTHVKLVSDSKRNSRRTSQLLPDGPPQALEEVEELATVEERDQETPTASPIVRSFSESRRLNSKSLSPETSAPSSPRPVEPAHSTSRFIEHLPYQSSTSPTSPTYGTSLPFTTNDPLSPSYQGDGVLFHSPATIPRPVTVKRGSHQSERSFASMETITPTPRGDSIDSSRVLVDSSSRGQQQPRNRGKKWKNVDRVEENDEGDDEVDERGKVGILDWLLCGCFSPGGDSDEYQQARTNPME